jgi:hypothetical protein
MFKLATSLAVEDGYDVQLSQSTVTQQEPAGFDRLVVRMRGDRKDSDANLAAKKCHEHKAD